LNFGHIRRDLAPACVGALATLPQAVAYGLIAIAPLGPDWIVYGIAASVGASHLIWSDHRPMGSQSIYDLR